MSTRYLQPLVSPSLFALVPQKSGRINQREREIGARVRELREKARLSQAAFAEQIAVTRDLLASVEYGRTPLRYAVAARLCERFNINARWLATGARPVRPFLEVHGQLEERIPSRMLFSEAYASVLDTYIEHRLEELAKSLNRKVADLETLGDMDTGLPIGGPFEDVVIHYLSRIVAINVRTMPQFLQQKYYLAILNASDQFLKKHEYTIRSFHETRRKLDLIERGKIKG